jgi:galactonate dehydratase
VRATARTVWLFVRLKTDAGLTALGEASDAFGFANTTAANVATMRAQLQSLFPLVEGRTPFDIESFRQRGWNVASGGLVPATAFSAMEVPAYALLGGKVRDRIPVDVTDGFTGAAPDLGALERGRPLPVYGPRPAP